MPIAAVPTYLGTDFSQASPGLRFSIYLPIWTERADQVMDVKKRAEAKSREGVEVADMLQRNGMDATIRQLHLHSQKPVAGLWEKNDFAAKEAWKKITQLTRRDKDTLAALLARQQVAFAAAGPEDARLSLAAQAVSPFTTGLGIAHPLENGFAFLNPYGLPYLPGSGIKGVLRQAARELASGEWGETQGWTDEAIHRLDVGHDTVELSVIDVLFGRESGEGDTQHVRGALSFWDVIPQIEGNSLAVDIMTLHQSHYYRQKTDWKSGESANPHDSGSPYPISFLTVPAGSGFSFHVCCDLAHLERLAPDLAHEGRWKALLAATFAHAFEWLGFGAKTVVGYGALAIDAKAQAAADDARRERAAAAEKAARLAGLSANQLLIERFVETFSRRADQLRGGKENPNAALHGEARKLARAAHEGGDWTAEERKTAADAIEHWLPLLVKVDIKDERKKLKLNALRGL